VSHTRVIGVLRVEHVTWSYNMTFALTIFHEWYTYLHKLGNAPNKTDCTACMSCPTLSKRGRDSRIAKRAELQRASVIRAAVWASHLPRFPLIILLSQVEVRLHKGSRTLRETSSGREGSPPPLELDLGCGVAGKRFLASGT